MSWIKWAKTCHPFPPVYIFNTWIKLCHLKIYFLYIFLYFLQVVDNTLVTYRRTRLSVHVALKLELCCFPFEQVPPHVFISKDAVLLIITEWPTLMPSLTSLTFHFLTSHEPQSWSFFPPPPPHNSCTSCEPQKECFCFFVPHIPHWHVQDSFCLPPGSATLALNKATCSYKLYLYSLAYKVSQATASTV